MGRAEDLGGEKKKSGPCGEAGSGVKEIRPFVKGIPREVTWPISESITVYKYIGKSMC